MKTLLVCMLVLVLTAATTTLASGVDPVRNRSKNEAKLPPGAAGICNSQRDAVFIFVAYKDGDIRSYKCERNVSSEYNRFPDNMTNPVALGALVLEKRNDGTGTDPCYQYQIDGETRAVCW